MAEQINKAIEQIAKINNCESGYILLFTKSFYRMIGFYGENEELYFSFNRMLFRLFEADEISIEKIINTKEYNELSKQKSFNSFFLKKISSGNEGRVTYYLLLFSTSKGNFNKLFAHKIEIDLKNLPYQLENFEKEKINSIRINEVDKISETELLDRQSTFEELLNTFFETSQDMVFELDNFGYFRRINPYGAAILDYDENELIGKHFMDLVSGKFKPIISQAFQEILKSNMIKNTESLLLSKEKREILFEINGKSIIIDGKIQGFLGIAKNITQLRYYEKKIDELNTKQIETERLIKIERSRSKQQRSFLEELNRLKSDFISNISHELRTPLASIIGFSESILSDPEMPAEMKNEFNQIILTEGKRLAKLVDDVLDISKIEDGKLELNKGECNIIKLIKDVIESNAENLENKDLTFTSELPDVKIILNADRDKLFQVFDGLINNAIKFTPKGGRVSVICQNLFKEFEVIVTDTGVGIPQKDIPYIFEKFYRVSRPGTEIAGTGLGLVFVKRIIDLHKGLITVQSEEKKGTSFIIKLPKSIKI